MGSKGAVLLLAALAWIIGPIDAGRAQPGRDTTRMPLDPRGEIHVPIGLPHTVDTLKTFVEAEGNFSPGVAEFWLLMRDSLLLEERAERKGLVLDWNRGQPRSV